MKINDRMRIVHNVSPIGISIWLLPTKSIELRSKMMCGSKSVNATSLYLLIFGVTLDGSAY